MSKSYKPRFATPGVIASIDDPDLFTFLEPVAMALRDRSVTIDGPDAIDRGWLRNRDASVGTA